MGTQSEAVQLSLCNSVPVVQFPKNVNIYDSLVIVTFFIKSRQYISTTREKTKIEYVFKLLLEIPDITF